jgi:hypothetical protein
MESDSAICRAPTTTLAQFAREALRFSLFLLPRVFAKNQFANYLPTFRASPCRRNPAFGAVSLGQRCCRKAKKAGRGRPVSPRLLSFPDELLRVLNFAG